MNTNKLKSFAQDARRKLRSIVGARLDYVLQTDTAELRQKKAQVEELRRQVDTTGRETVIEAGAYTWFNRFTALRFMDANGFTGVGAVSPAPGHSQPELLAEFKRGFVDDDLDVDRDHLNGILDGRIPTADPQNEVYRLLLLAVCNAWHRVMPFLFEELADSTELLMPDDLLSDSSILADILAGMPDEECAEVEIIGWLYQFYISEKKDQVMARKKAVPKEDIAAVTQLFTPHWIVRYLVENSLGRLWMLNHPESTLVERMEYYIPPLESGEWGVGSGECGESVQDVREGEAGAESESTHCPLSTIHLRISSPEEIRICDPACGSGHMLTYAFDLLYAIYEEQGYRASEIPRLILEKNLYGIEIDRRAGQLAAFALAMKARQVDRRFFRREHGAAGCIEPGICVLEPVSFTDDEIRGYMHAVGEDLFTAELQTLLRQFGEADNFGSLIRPVLDDVSGLRATLESRNLGGDLFLYGVHQRVLKVLKQADCLAPKYHVVVANPPYHNKFNPALKAYAQDYYPDYKADLFTIFIKRNLEMTVPKGQLGFMTPFVWMFISTYEKLRQYLIDHKTITSLVQLEYSGFEGATVPICTFTLENAHRPEYRGGYVSLSDFRGAKMQGPKAKEIIQAARSAGK